MSKQTKEAHKFWKEERSYFPKKFKEEEKPKEKKAK